MTLAFELETLRYLQQPRSVITGMRQCAQYVGIVVADQDAARAFVARHRVEMDFTRDIDTYDTFGGLDDVRTDFKTNRYVLIGVTPHEIFGRTPEGWEYLTVELAARKAGWLLNSDTVPSDRWIHQQIQRFCR